LKSPQEKNRFGLIMVPTAREARLSKANPGNPPVRFWLLQLQLRLGEDSDACGEFGWKGLVKVRSSQGPAMQRVPMC
jgi:hypothetical protein